MSTTFYNLAAAITQAENSQWPNNPGALEDTAGNKLTFASVTDGFNALVSKLGFDASGQSHVYTPDMPLSKFGATYSGGDSNYASNLANILGVSTSTPLSQLSDQALGAPDATGTGVPSLSDLSAPTYSPEASGVAAASGKVPTNTVGAGAAQGSSGNSLLDTLAAWAKNIQSYEADAVAVVIGIVLIGGAIFSFKAVQGTVVNVAKKGAAIAAA